MALSKPVAEIIHQRHSCREYQKTPIDAEKRQQLADFIAANQTGPFGSPTRFELIAATDAEREALRGLGTYGFIKDPTGFIVGAMGEEKKNLEDFGYAMEHMILCATELGLGTCWLGGSFTKSRFAKTIATTDRERVPAVTSVGIIARKPGIRQRFSNKKQRLAWNQLFFERAFGKPLARDDAGAYATPLEMVRLGPSASNKQPWRVVKDGAAYHLYIQRSPGYRHRWLMRLMNVDDMQRLDAGIAMCHFELTAGELGLAGQWTIDEPPIQTPDKLTEYIVSWSER